MRFKRYFLAGICAFSLVVLSAFWYQASSIRPQTMAQSVDSSQKIDFSNGVNLTHWFFLPVVADEKMETSAYLNKWLTTAEVAKIAKVGFTHVRLPIDPNFLQPNWAKGDFQIRADRLQAIDQAINLLETANLGIILDLHPTRRLALESQPYGADYQNIETIWRTLSDRYRQNSQMIAYEILNEPLVENPALWESIAQKLVTLIRQVDSTHTIIVPAHGFSGVGELLDFKPISGDRLLYTFHFYMPLAFTHQGASWVENYESLRDIPYPVGININEIIPPSGRSQWSLETKKLWKEYQGSQANRSQLEKEVKKVAQWRDRYRVSIYCGEYGVHNVAPKADRYRWHQDISEILNQANIGRAMWSYRGNFGLLADGQNEADAQFLQAIGLTQSKT